ncbi:hypothetical protein [Rhizobium miluonense]|uniref:Uncharacterized protein n=1 Tax=Rhizobium miluonense TaxID=411945 RepID=A0A1C3UCX3_9HYPH|nr:hypothetical protein [Rhizobium miluonense]SCB13331.1 hypothetical protein GA0061102_10037 [Rhizobium miluonense]
MRPVFDGGNLSHFFAGSIYLCNKPAVEGKIGRSFNDDHRPIATFRTKRSQNFSHSPFYLSRTRVSLGGRITKGCTRSAAPRLAVDGEGVAIGKSFQRMEVALKNTIRRMGKAVAAAYFEHLP